MSEHERALPLRHKEGCGHDWPGGCRCGAQTLAEDIRAAMGALTARAAAAEAELGAVSAAIGSVRWMDPPDGGSVTLAEQVQRMRDDLSRAEAALAYANDAAAKGAKGREIGTALECCVEELSEARAEVERLKADQADWRKGVAYIRAAAGMGDGPLSPGDIARRVLEIRAEVERLHSWAGLMELLDEHWPEGIFPTRADDPERDPGARIVSLLRWVDRLTRIVGLQDQQLAMWQRSDLAEARRLLERVEPEMSPRNNLDLLDAIRALLNPDVRSVTVTPLVPDPGPMAEEWEYMYSDGDRYVTTKPEIVKKLEAPVMKKKKDTRAVCSMQVYRRHDWEHPGGSRANMNHCKRCGLDVQYCDYPLPQCAVAPRYTVMQPITGPLYEKPGTHTRGAETFPGLHRRGK